MFQSFKISEDKTDAQIGVSRQGTASSRRDAAQEKAKEGTKSDDSFPQRGYEINPK